jgi:hypothetical protein
VSADAFAAIDGALGRGGDPDDALREVVATLVDRAGCAWAGILFREQGELVLGPQAGEPRPSERTQLPVVFDGAVVAQLVADACPDAALLERVAVAISPYCLVGWDTGGEPWEP